MKLFESTTFPFDSLSNIQIFKATTLIGPAYPFPIFQLHYFPHSYFSLLARLENGKMYLKHSKKRIRTKFSIIKHFYIFKGFIYLREKERVHLDKRGGEKGEGEAGNPI